MADSQETIDSQDWTGAHTTTDPATYPDDEASRLDTPSSNSKQKRKRTSPRDHAILEAAYQENSKPDKDERLNLVKRVDLGEKEVQIWFQNRRQNDRRKSKPLQPHELIPHFRNGIPVEAGSQLPSPQNSQEPAPNAGTRTSTNLATSTTQASPRPIGLKALLNDSDAPSSSSPAVQRSTAEEDLPALSTPPSSFESPSQRQPPNTSPAEDITGAATQITKKRSHEQMTGTQQSAASQDESSNNAKSLRRTSSFVRLAVSSDGSVKVRVNDETTPSPPKRCPLPPPNMTSRKSSAFSRAQSDLGSAFNFKDANPAVTGVLGRSRDTRTWEFYCDRSARSSLAARAEEEATGSAVGALGLMRSASQRRAQALSPNPAKQNRIRRAHSKPQVKPSLMRAQSSMARLQSSDGIYDENDMPRKKPVLHRKSSGGDSDKENWMPGTRDSVHDMRRPETSTSGGRVLKESGAPRATHAHPVSTAAGDNEKRPTAAPVKEKGDDLDCVQGLLSLSQGAWR